MKKKPDPAPQSRTPFERTIPLDTEGFHEITVTVEPLEVGFNVTFPIATGTAAVYDDHLDGALEAAVKRVTEANRELHDGTRTTRTDVDGAEAEIIHGNGAPPQQRLPMHTAAECAAEVHRCQGELARRTRTFEDAKSAMKAAESAVDTAFAALLDATDRAAKPELPFETAVPA